VRYATICGKLVTFGFFKKKIVPVIDLVNQAQEGLSDYQNHLKQNSGRGNRATRTCSNNIESWNPPRSVLKLNVDAHLLGDGHWALGWILRWEDESWVGAATRVVQGIDKPVEVEARGIIEAVNYLAIFQPATVIIETDNNMVVKAVQTRQFNMHYWGHIARKIRETMDENPNLSISWVNRAKNVVAHYLAKWAEVEPNKTWTNNLPLPHIVALVINDMENLPPHI
jgi:hypothetical protein